MPINIPGQCARKVPPITGDATAEINAITADGPGEICFEPNFTYEISDKLKAYSNQRWLGYYTVLQNTNSSATNNQPIIELDRGVLLPGGTEYLVENIEMVGFGLNYQNRPDVPNTDAISFNFTETSGGVVYPPAIQQLTASNIMLRQVMAHRTGIGFECAGDTRAGLPNSRAHHVKMENCRAHIPSIRGVNFHDMQNVDLTNFWDRAFANNPNLALGAMFRNMSNVVMQNLYQEQYSEFTAPPPPPYGIHPILTFDNVTNLAIDSIRYESCHIDRPGEFVSVIDLINTQGVLHNLEWGFTGDNITAGSGGFFRFDGDTNFCIDVVRNSGGSFTGIDSAWGEPTATGRVWNKVMSLAGATLGGNTAIFEEWNGV